MPHADLSRAEAHRSISRRTRFHALPLAVVACFLLTLLSSFRRALTLPFLNDDYLILDKVIHRGFTTLWTPSLLLFNWYRPWSREFHYWVLVRLFGPHEPGFHLVSFVLWIVDMLLYFVLVRRCGGTAVTATLATVGAAALAIWSAPLLWVAGVQELWFLAFALGFMIAVSYRQAFLSWAILVLALLSKEVAAILPAVGALQLVLVHRERVGRFWRSVLMHGVTVGAWAVLHPTLRARMFGPLQVSAETVGRPSVAATAVKTILAQFNLDDVPRPESGWAGMLPQAIFLALMGIAAIFLVRRRLAPAQDPVLPKLRRRLALFGIAWCTMGWSILLLPSIGWHPYYCAFGSLGFWLALAVGIESRPRLAACVIAAVLVLREARLETPSWDWGTYWYQERAGSFLGGIRAQMFGYYPVLPSHSRLYFANLPNNIGLVAADGPAFRVWYGDSTLKAGFYSQYVRRRVTDPGGQDFFFRYDPAQGLTEVNPGAEPSGRALDAQWERNQRVLATLFLKSGELSKAAEIYSKLWHHRQQNADYALYAAGLYGAMGDSSRYHDYLSVLDRQGRGAEARAALPELLHSAREFASAGN